MECDQLIHSQCQMYWDSGIYKVFRSSYLAEEYLRQSKAFTVWKWPLLRATFEKALTHICSAHSSSPVPGSPLRIHIRKSFNIIFGPAPSVYNEPGSSVGIATGYGLDGPGIESRWGARFSHTSRPPVQWAPGFPGDKAAGAWCWPPTPF
jgi:hypothetical protein